MSKLSRLRDISVVDKQIKALHYELQVINTDTDIYMYMYHAICKLHEQCFQITSRMTVVCLGSMQ